MNSDAAHVINQIVKYIHQHHGQTYEQRSMPVRQWFEAGDYSVYVRVYWSVITEMTFDLATIDVQEASRGQKFLTNLLEAIEEATKEVNYDTIHIENVMNERMQNFVERKGYIQKMEIGAPSNPKSYLKFVKEPVPSYKLMYVRRLPPNFDSAKR